MEPNNTKPAPKKTNKVFVIILIFAGGSRRMVWHH